MFKSNLDDELKLKLNEISRFCFRDVADHDYISARILFRNELIQQAYWFSEQAVEKYLKSILLFNEMSIKSVGHDLSKALLKVENFSHIKIELPEDVKKSITELNNEGKNRYYEYPYSYGELTIWKLDKLVWYIRRYCISKNVFIKVGDKEINLQQSEIVISHKDFYQKNPIKYKFPSHGVLETILGNKKSIMRKHLIWKNQYFGERQKGRLKNINIMHSYGIPPHFRDKYQIDELNKYIQFSKDVIEYLKNNV